MTDSTPNAPVGLLTPAVFGFGLGALLALVGFGSIALVVANSAEVPATPAALTVPTIPTLPSHQFHVEVQGGFVYGRWFCLPEGQVVCFALAYRPSSVSCLPVKETTFDCSAAR